ncbi:LacI family transcriptional regulator [Sphingomonas jejuensis]|uniref:LacI family transcriptional regulator n=1 Tax=Sphingomonas jejuensis TaxID=904715 RepID=A0ABX0XHX8_9SPHN|nr:LacI family DNA-binding transcriptional regulator [Sphingomonas jejuensis]NJC32943.1 LacI family transcriptional regulator [Sphingomonas jejuensis]
MPPGTRRATPAGQPPPERAISRKPTIDDVAARSGVGRTTVSRVLNNGPNVSAKLRARVQEAVDALGYQVNIQARFLAGGNSRTVALICAAELDLEPNSYYQSALEVGALRACTQLGLHLITHAAVQDDPRGVEEVVALVEERRCDGVVLTPPFADDTRLIDALVARGCAVACVSPGDATGARVPGVGMDDERAGYDLAAHLLALGHRRFGFIRGREGHRSAESRFDGVMRALAEARLDPADVADARGNFTFMSGKDLLPTLLSAAARPTAVVCANDDTAAGALFAAHQLGIDVPGALSIVGFDDTPVSAIVWPPLTTVHQPIREMSFRAVEMLAEALKTPGEAQSPVHEYIAHTVVSRRSTGRPELEALPIAATGR